MSRTSDLAWRLHRRLGVVPQAFFLLGADLQGDLAAALAAVAGGQGNRLLRRWRRICAEVASFSAPSGAALRRELGRRFATFEAVRRTAAELESAAELGDLAGWIDRLEARGLSLSPWRLEGLGFEIVRRRLRGGATRDLLPHPWPDHAGPMLHAGLGHAVATHLLDSLPGTVTVVDLEALFDLFETTVAASSAEAWQDIALEALGLQLYFFYRGLFALADEALRRRRDPQLHRLSWHGVGRAIYFLPVQQIPGGSSLRRAIERLEKLTPAGASCDCGIAGIAYAFTLVNLEDSELFEVVIGQHRELLTSRPFGAGVAAALHLHPQLLPRSSAAAQLAAHVPQDPAVAAAYADLVSRGWQQGCARSPAVSQLYRSLRLPPPAIHEPPSRSASELSHQRPYGEKVSPT